MRKQTGTKPTLVGVISDTHGLIRPEALSALADADLIIHAGDIGKLEVIAALRSVAKVVAVRGNNARGKMRVQRREAKHRLSQNGTTRSYLMLRSDGWNRGWNRGWIKELELFSLVKSASFDLKRNN